MTFIDLIVIILYLLFVVVFSKFTGLDAYAVALVTGITLVIIWGGLSVYRSRFALPKCRNVRCKKRRYRGIGYAKDMGIADPGIILECKCGQRYILMETTFMALIDGKRPIKYMRRKSPADKWQIDEEPEK